MFRRNVLPASSEAKIKRNKQAVKWNNDMLKTIIFFMRVAVRTSDLTRMESGIICKTKLTEFKKIVFRNNNFCQVGVIAEFSKAFVFQSFPTDGDNRKLTELVISNLPKESL
jgi:hypothetical protein